MRKLNFINITQNLLPPHKRVFKLVSFLKILVSPLQSLNDYLVTTFYKETERNAKWNSQVVLFTKLLNDLHNPFRLYSDIYVDGGIEDLIIYYFFNEVENKSIYFHNEVEAMAIYFHNEVEYIQEFDFKVYYPIQLESIKDLIESTVNQYRRVDRNFEMISF